MNAQEARQELMSKNPSAQDLTRDMIHRFDELKGRLEQYQDRTRQLVLESGN
jgi:hypothetical protein